MARKNFKEIFKKAFIIISGISFFWFSAEGVLRMMTQSQTLPQQSQQSSPEQKLEQEKKGYELVLTKEPDNIFALEKLVEINLQQRDLSSALPLTEKLVALQPDNKRYQEVLQIIKQGLQAEKNKTSPPPPGNNSDNNEKK